MGGGGAGACARKCPTLTASAVSAQTRAVSRRTDESAAEEINPDQTG